jgi:hypothetical protein
MQDLRSVVDYLVVGMADGRAMPELLRELGARCDGFTRRRRKSPLYAHLQQIEAELAAFERLQRIAGRQLGGGGRNAEGEAAARRGHGRSRGRCCSSANVLAGAARGMLHNRLIPVAGHAT